MAIKNTLIGWNNSLNWLTCLQGRLVRYYRSTNQQWPTAKNLWSPYRREEVQRQYSSPKWWIQHQLWARLIGNRIGRHSWVSCSLRARAAKENLPRCLQCWYRTLSTMESSPWNGKSTRMICIRIGRRWNNGKSRNYQRLGRRIVIWGCATSRFSQRSQTWYLFRELKIMPRGLRPLTVAISPQGALLSSTRSLTSPQKICTVLRHMVNPAINFSKNSGRRSSTRMRIQSEQMETTTWSLRKWATEVPRKWVSTPSTWTTFWCRARIVNWGQRSQSQTRVQMNFREPLLRNSRGSSEVAPVWAKATWRANCWSRNWTSRLFIRSTMMIIACRGMITQWTPIVLAVACQRSLEINARAFVITLPTDLWCPHSAQSWAKEMQREANQKSRKSRRPYQYLIRSKGIRKWSTRACLNNDRAMSDKSKFIKQKWRK